MTNLILTLIFALPVTLSFAFAYLEGRETKRREEALRASQEAFMRECCTPGK